MNELVFDEHTVLHKLSHYLPSQAPLKDFIHHNTLHAFQHLSFHEATGYASALFGYKTRLSIREFRQLYKQDKIKDSEIDKAIIRTLGANHLALWKNRLLYRIYDENIEARAGQVRKAWKRDYQFDMDARVHAHLFRILNSYLDQGISIWNFPVHEEGFLASLKLLEAKSYTSIFNTPRAGELFLRGSIEIAELLKMLVGNESYYERYLFDQQFAHPGWSGLVATIEAQPDSLLSPKRISLKELIQLELLLEVDALDRQFGLDWEPLAARADLPNPDLFEHYSPTELDQALCIWQEAYEWSYYDEVISGIQQASNGHETKTHSPSFQAMFCIDDRECSIRRYVEHLAPDCETFGTPGHFGVEFYYQPEHGKFHTKVCPAPITPKHLIKEVDTSKTQKKDFHFGEHSHRLFGGWVISQTLGFWSALRLFINVFRPSISPATASSFRHMDKVSRLTVEAREEPHFEGGLQVGFTVKEMAATVERVMKSIGLVSNFSPLVYLVGHGSSSVNNTHYAGYDCGACSGRPGSVNARAFSFMANHPKVREMLETRGIHIPNQTQFMGGLHDTSRDEMEFYDETSLNPQNLALHQENLGLFEKALELNARERSRRFESIHTEDDPGVVHKRVKRRTVSLFEPRPELNHATNALCIVGRRALTKGLFLDRRAFLNSFDYKVDPNGDYLLTILNAAAPVCGGINLEYFFSRVDNEKLGAGTKLPHNVMGLIGVANGIEGDLRPGLPLQMIEVHDPVRLLLVVEHYPEAVTKTIQRNPSTFEWFVNDWIKLVVIHPETKAAYVFSDGTFSEYRTPLISMGAEPDMESLITRYEENIPVVLLN